MQVKVNKFRFRNKIASFDYDHTLVKPKNGATFPKNVDDWEWLRPNVPDIVKSFYQKGYCIMIFTNQSKKWKVDQIKLVIEQLEIPVLISIGFDEKEQKPNTIMFMNAINNKTWDIKKSFYCGDALGRQGDWSDTDKLFAKAIKISIKEPEILFPFEDKKTGIIPSKTQEIIILVGYQASGKSTISDSIFGKAGYIIIHGDDYKSSISKMIKAGIAPIKEGKSIVFDATNPSIKKRAEYIEFAKEYKIPVRCIHVNTSMEESMFRNNQREKPIPKIAYYMYRKNFEEPTLNEGFNSVEII